MISVYTYKFHFIFKNKQNTKLTKKTRNKTIKTSIIKRILNLQSNLIFLLQHFLKSLQFLPQQIINLHLLLNQHL